MEPDQVHTVEEAGKEKQAEERREEGSAPRLMVMGVELDMPIKPYATQMVLMSQLLRAVTSSKNALLEAPTGTGKTLALLCSTLGWLRHHRMQKPPPSPLQTDAVGASDAESASHVAEPVVLYCSRTHSQLAQVVEELRRTVYRPRMVVLASRDRYCVNAEVMAAPDRVTACRELVSAGRCSYEREVAGFVRSHEQSSSESDASVFSADEFRAEALGSGACAFFAAKEVSHAAQLVLCPYNYILDPYIRHHFGVPLRGAVHVVDEAHNLEDTAREAMSFDLPMATLQHLADVANSVDRFAPSISKLANVQGAFQRIRVLVNAMAAFLEAEFARNFPHAPLPPDSDPLEVHYRGEELRDLLAGCGLTGQTVMQLRSEFAQLQTYLTERGRRNDDDGSYDDILGAVMPLQAFVFRWSNLFVDGVARTEAYVIALRRKPIGPPADPTSSSSKPIESFMEQPVISSSSSSSVQRPPFYGVEEVSLWCLDPSLALHGLKEQLRSIVLASGTLSPMETLASELGVDFSVRLEGRHVIDVGRQLYARVVARSADGTELLGTYEHQRAYGYQDALGDVVLGTCKRVPDGVLLFVPSYSLLSALMRRWKTTGLLADLERVKQVVSEPRTSSQFGEAMQHMADAINAGRGALLLAVYRGKAAEGIDFSDRMARAVLLVGVPYPSTTDAQVRLKRSFNDSPPNGRVLLDGRTWYAMQAWRAVNQALGRCIRHKLDYGAVLLLDSRYGPESGRVHLSRWLREAVRPDQPYASLMEGLHQFFIARKDVAQSPILTTYHEPNPPPHSPARNSSRRPPTRKLAPVAFTKVVPESSPLRPKPNPFALRPPLSSPPTHPPSPQAAAEEQGKKNTDQDFEEEEEVFEILAPTSSKKRRLHPRGGGDHES